MNEYTLFPGCAWCSPLVQPAWHSFTLGPRCSTHCFSGFHFIPDRLNSHWFWPTDSPLQAQAHKDRAKERQVKHLVALCNFGVNINLYFEENPAQWKPSFQSHISCKFMYPYGLSHCVFCSRNEILPKRGVRKDWKSFKGCCLPRREGWCCTWREERKKQRQN